MKKTTLTKLLSLLILCTLTFSFVSCSSKEAPQDNNEVLGSQTPDPPKPEVETPKPEPPKVETPAPQPESKPEPPKVTETNISNNKISWWYVPNKLGKLPGINSKIGFNLKDYNAIYFGDTSRKVLHLTIDEGYENGYTAQILDVLKKNNVKATFFVTSPYIKENPALVKRMVNEGHIVGNHSKNHPSMPTVTSDQTKFNTEFNDVEILYKNLIGQDMPKYFRPPMGEYSQKSLSMTNNLGYKTVFWSFAYNDWDINKQPEKAYAKQKILDGLHPGAVLLLHAVSKTNTEILDDVIKEAKALGYEFELLK